MVEESDTDLGSRTLAVSVTEDIKLASSTPSDVCLESYSLSDLLK